MSDQNKGMNANDERKRMAAERVFGLRWADEGMLVAPFAAASCSDQFRPGTVSRASSLEQA